MNQCKHLGNKYSRSDNLKQHQISCTIKNKPETIMEAGVERQYGANDDRSPFAGENTIPVNNDKKRKTFIDSIITKDESLGTDKLKIQQPSLAEKKSVNSKISALMMHSLMMTSPQRINQQHFWNLQHQKSCPTF